MNTLNSSLFAAVTLSGAAVAIYFLISNHLRRHSPVARMLRDEKIRSQIAAEATQALLSLPTSREVLNLLVTRLSEFFDVSECSIVQLGDDQLAKILARSSTPSPGDAVMDLQAYPEIRQATESRELLFHPNTERGGVPRSVVAIPLLAHRSVLGMLYLEFKSQKDSLGDDDRRFLRMMAGIAAVALRNAQLLDEMEHKAKTDYLTGLVNHRSFQVTLSTELARARRHGHQLSILIADIDHLKAVNEKMGHVIGDSVIREIAETVRTSCRSADMAARYGGEEYAVILPEAPLVEALQVAERIRERVNESIYTGAGHVTVSIGVASYPTDALGKDDLIRAAEKALQTSKTNGRNRVSYFDAGVGKQPA